METSTAIKEETKTPQGNTISDYELLSGFFIYPEDESYVKKIEDTYIYLSAALPESAETMRPFIEFMADSTVPDMQELFLRSFDVQAITTLDIGFTLFGEDYKRGQLLVNLNREHRDAGNTCHTELSDHLPNVLRLLSKMKDEAMRNEIALRLVIPAVEKMIGEFDTQKIEKKDKIYKKNLKTIIDYSPRYRTIYQTLLQALFIALKKDFSYEPGSAEVPAGVEEQEIGSMACGTCSSCSPVSNDFSRNIETEMNIEKY